MRLSTLLSGGLFAVCALAETSGYCCTSNDKQQVVPHNDQTQDCCRGRFDGTECWIPDNGLDALTSCCKGKGSAMCAF
ncbi:hypothetical protein CGCF415_v012393 [Colletotrichum fructicola]|uniref:Uncharacterized protein n=1 Tax=Colletotrichum fructicola (strain Nara gc5) TaxID=1213859 RepID=L2FUL6_COLFN|nr:uncharacterized protein CGMCC3_g2498 [Colletotrichum fructicola]KAF4476450.1 hypothetical protein CGGC5_v014456 [Colletotrichum fructicola Nara gc5]KAI8307229.1 hypothetical protein K4K59_011115 [Colletotrichum sp. SAR11_240]KAE9581154.1 hypothetical protein CGMCC3_g2498 [Colletotrichum fructicola]KAF4427652.1 hypothetical protein CFRS1_v006096 [Colletotrichum fructicola]KAF4886931.1 hypothetical protein CGCFRS4_v010872 [Colletotrichum fructicola]